MYVFMKNSGYLRRAAPFKGGRSEFSFRLPGTWICTQEVKSSCSDLFCNGKTGQTAPNGHMCGCGFRWWRIYRIRGKEER